MHQIHSLGSDALAVQADLSQPSPARSIVDHAVARFGQVDILALAIVIARSDSDEAI